MRVLGGALLTLGLGLCFAIDDCEFIGLVPVAIGFTLLTIGEKKASALALTRAALIAPAARQSVRRPQKQLPPADSTELSPEVLQLLERLNRSSKHR